MRSLKPAFLWLAFGATVAMASEESPGVATHRLSERVLVLTTETPTFNNLTAIATEKGIVVVDTTPSPRLAARLREIVAREFGRDDFVYTINTHHHWDHVFGNQAFADTLIIAHRRTPARIRRSIPSEGHPAPWLEASPVLHRRQQLEKLDPASARARRLEKEILWFQETYDELAQGFVATFPALTFRDHLSLDLGDATLNLYYYGQADTNNSILVHIPEEGLVVAGDLFWSGGFFTDFGDGLDLEIPRWIEVLDTVLRDRRPIRWTVSGHRDVWSGEHLQWRRRYIVELWAGVQEARKAGRNLRETQERLTLDGIPYYSKLGFSHFFESEGRLDEYRPEEEQRENVAAFWRQTQTPAAGEMERTLEERGLEASRRRLQEMKADSSDAFYFDEREFNRLGYRYLRAQRPAAAVAVLEAGAELFPESWNAFDSLGEAYAAADDRAAARESFRRSLALNPENENSRRRLRGLEANAAAEASATARAVPITQRPGSPVLRPSPQELPAAYTSEIALGDLDGDGDLDAVFANMRLHPSRVWINDGKGFLVDSGQLLTHLGHGADLGDLDGDGDLDLVIECATFEAGGVQHRQPSRIYFNDGTGTFEDSGQELGDTSLSALRGDLADMDGNGTLDLVIHYYDQPGLLFLNDGKGRFSRSTLSVPEGANLGDLDGDGDPDAFLRTASSGYRSVLMDGLGETREHWALPMELADYGNVALADLDGDGDLDAFSSNGIRESASPSRVFLNDGGGAFNDSGQRLGLADGGTPSAGDLDGDGDLDIFLSRFHGANEIWLNDGRGSFTGLSLGRPGPTRVPTLGDLDGDGDLDLIVGSYGGRTRILFNDGPSAP